MIMHRRSGPRGPRAAQFDISVAWLRHPWPWTARHEASEISHRIRRVDGGELTSGEMDVARTRQVPVSHWIRRYFSRPRRYHWLPVYVVGRGKAVIGWQWEWLLGSPLLAPRQESLLPSTVPHFRTSALLADISGWGPRLHWSPPLLQPC